MLLKPGNESFLFVTGVASHIHEAESEDELRAVAEVTLDGGSPLLANGFRDFGPAVPWEVDDDESVLNVEEVNQLGASGGRRDTGELAAVAEFVDEGGFADV